MRLSALMDLGLGQLTPGPDDLDVTGVTADSRAVEPGFLFAALEGTQADGARFIPQAIDAGAAAVLIREGRSLEPMPSVPVLTHADPRRALALIAARVHPGQPDLIAAVTGTNGKTSVATFMRQIWDGLGRPAASMGTLGVFGPEGKLDLQHTTPDPVTIHQTLEILTGQGTTRLALEASSHGLDQRRLDGVRIAHAGFTNLTRDHLDYHGTPEAYAAAKQRLFTEAMAPDGIAVINMAGPGAVDFLRMAQEAGRRTLTTGTPDADLALERAMPVDGGIDLALRYGGRALAVCVPLYGSFQAQNICVAIGLLIACGEAFEAIVPLTERLQGAPGRLELVARGTGSAPIFVDYAHTPDALANVLEALRPHVQGRLHVVFGCGGDRDKGKRPQMGAIAARLADHVIVTDDNPRSEDPAAIRAEILKATPEAQDIGDRAEAIGAAVTGLRTGDVLVVAGKGHETGQIVGDRVHPFNDADAVRSAIA